MARRRKRKRRRHEHTKQKHSHGDRVGDLHVTYPNGRTATVPDTGDHHFPIGTMISWNVRGRCGRPEMRWTVVGGGWPFDD